MDFFAARQIMVDSQVRVNDVTDHKLQKAMRTIARERLCAPSQSFCAYGEVEVEIAPHRVLMMVRDLAKILQAVAPKAGETALGLCAPYASAVLADMQLHVSAVEAESRTLSVVEPYLHELGVKTSCADLSALTGQYDVIIVEGAVSDMPQAWFKALKEGGRLGVVVKSARIGRAHMFTKRGGEIIDKALFDSPTSLIKGFEPKLGFVF